MSEPTVADLVARAGRVEQGAWDTIVTRYQPLVRSVMSNYRLDADDMHDVSQTVWLRLVEHLGDIREPRALPAWIVTTARHEAWRVATNRNRAMSVDPHLVMDLSTCADGADPNDNLLRHERHQAPA